MVRTMVVLALVACGFGQVLGDPLPPGAPAIRLATSVRPVVDQQFEGTRLRVDSDRYEGVWNLGAVVVRDFPLEDGLEVDLELTSFDVVAADARFVVVRAAGESEFAAPRMRFFRGVVAVSPGSMAYLWMHDGAIGGLVQILDGAGNTRVTYVFGPSGDGGVAQGESDGTLAIARTKAIPEAGFCEACRNRPGDEQVWAQPALETGGISDAALKARVAFDTTAKYILRFRSAEQATSYALALLGAVSTIYERDLGCLLELSYFRLHEGDSPYSDDAFDPRTLLNEVQLEWTTNPALVNVTRAAVQLLHSPLALGGVANIDSLCDDELSYSVAYIQADYDHPLDPWSYDLYVVSHEFGHNFGSDHTHCYDPPIDHCGSWPGCYEGEIEQTAGTIMSYCDEIGYVFHERVIDLVRPRLEDAVCVDVVGQPSWILGGPGQGLLVDQGPLLLSLESDDGSPDAVVGAPGEVRLTWAKRFAPPCSSFELQRVEVLIHDPSVQPGRPLQLLVYLDPTGSGQPGNSILVHSEVLLVQTVSSVDWNEYVLSPPLTLEGGDLYLGFHDLEPDVATTFLASQDSSHSGDSYWAWDSTDPGEFTLQPGATWLVRGHADCADSTLFLNWSEPCNSVSVPGQDFGIYQGTLEPPFDDHAALTCTTGHVRSLMLPAMPPGDAYFIVVPSTGEGEGGYGTLSPADVPCKSSNVGDCD